MKWPRGKYNGHKIQGFSFVFRLRVLRWVFIPKFDWNFGEPYFLWLCFQIRFETEYKYEHK